MSGKAASIRPYAGVAIGVVCVLPIAYLLALSLGRGWAFPRLLPESISFDLWRDMWSGESKIGSSFLLSFLVSGVVGIVSTLVGFLGSKYVAYHRHKRVLLFLAYLPFVMSPIILGTCIHFLYIKVNLAGGITGVVFAQLIFALGFSMIFFHSFWNDERKGLEEIGKSLGGNTRKVYTKVLLPVAAEMLLIGFLQTFLFSWFQYGITLLIGAGKVKTLPILVFMYVGEANIYYAALSSLLLVVPPVLMLWANKKFMYRYI